MASDGERVEEQVAAFAATLSPEQQAGFIEVLEAFASVAGPDREVEGFVGNLRPANPVAAMGAMTDASKRMHELAMSIIDNMRA